MKASINEAGALIVEAETGLEKWALQKWLEDWPKRKVLFGINHGEHFNVYLQYPEVLFPPQPES